MKTISISTIYLLLIMVLFACTSKTDEQSDQEPIPYQYILKTETKGVSGFQTDPRVYISTEPYHQPMNIALSFMASGAINKDGKPGIVFATHPYLKEEWCGIDGDGNGLINNSIPTPGQIWYFESDGNLLVDKTIEQLGSRETRVMTRRVLLNDLNKDGVSDIFIAGSYEDMRHFSNGDECTAQNPIYLSQPDGTHRRYYIGYRAWTHAIEVADLDSNGTKEFLNGAFCLDSSHFGGYASPTRIYQIEPNGKWSDVTDTFSRSEPATDFVSPDTMVADDFTGDGLVDIISEPPIEEPNMPKPVLYINHGHGRFERADFSIPVPFIDYIWNIPYTCWTGQEGLTRVGVLPNGRWFAGAAVSFSIKIKANNDELPDYLYHYYGWLVSEEAQAKGRADEVGEASFFWTLLINEGGGKFSMIDDPFGINLKPWGFRGAFPVDLTGDGVDDIVIQTDHPNLGEVIFINDGNGHFISIGDRIGNFSVTNPVPMDVDEDGRMDLVGFKDDCPIVLKAVNPWPSYTELSSQ